LVTSDHNFVLSDQDGVLVGHMSFQVKKIICSPDIYQHLIGYESVSGILDLSIGF